MSRHQRTVRKPRGVAGLEQVGHDVHGAVIPLREHRHGGTEICYLAGGEVIWMLGGRRLRLTGGMISVIGPGLSHRGELDVIAPSDLYWTVLRAGELRPAPEAGLRRTLEGPQPYAAPAPERVGELFALLLEECAARRRGWRSAAGAALTSLAVACARLAGARGARKREELPAPVERAVRLLARNLERPPEVRELARAAGLGPTRFHRLFKKSLGLTPRDHLTRLRLAEARRELAGGCRDITELAIRLGFPSSQHFATTFKKHTGLSPSAYRRRESAARGGKG